VAAGGKLKLKQQNEAKNVLSELFRSNNLKMHKKTTTKRKKEK